MQIDRCLPAGNDVGRRGDLIPCSALVRRQKHAGERGYRCPVPEIAHGNGNRAVRSRGQRNHRLVAARSDDAVAVGRGEDRRPGRAGVVADIDTGCSLVGASLDRGVECRGNVRIGNKRGHRRVWKPSTAGARHRAERRTAIGAAKQPVACGGRFGRLRFEGRRQNRVAPRQRVDDAHARKRAAAECAPCRAGVGGVEQTGLCATPAVANIELAVFAVIGDADAGDDGLSGRIRRIEAEAADRQRRLLVSERRPRGAAIIGDPDAAIWRTGKIGIRSEREIGQHRLHRTGFRPVRGGVGGLNGVDRPGPRTRSLRIEVLIDLDRRLRRCRVRCGQKRNQQQHREKVA